MAGLVERIKNNGLFKASFDISTNNPSEEIDAEMAKGMVDVIALGTALVSNDQKINPLTVIYSVDLGRHVINAGVIAVKHRRSKTE